MPTVVVIASVRMAAPRRWGGGWSIRNTIVHVHTNRDTRSRTKDSSMRRVSAVTITVVFSSIRPVAIVDTCVVVTRMMTPTVVVVVSGIMASGMMVSTVVVAY